jgi:hypothetical protein
MRPSSDQSAGMVRALIRSEDRRKVVVVFRTPGDPANIPHDIENRRGSDENRPGTGSAGQRPVFALRRSSLIRPAQPLKVETRVQIPLGLPTEKDETNPRSFSSLIWCWHLLRERK